MSNAWKITIVVGLLIAVGGILALKIDRSVSTPESRDDPAPPLPRLLELGGSSCKMCQLMKPVLEELKTEYAGKLRVEAVDVFENPQVGDEYAVTLIPTQIFFDASGQQLYRHIGFISKEDILARWKRLGIELDQTSPNAEKID